MQNGFIDMGFNLSESNQLLDSSLAYALINGLYKCADNPLLCDFSDNAKTYTGFDLLKYSLALSEIFANSSEKEFLGLAIPPSFLGAIANYSCIFAKKVPVNLNFTLGKSASKDCVDIADIDTIITTRFFEEKIRTTNPNFAWTSNIVYLEECLASLTSETFHKIDNIISNGPNSIIADFDLPKEALNKLGTLVFTSGSEGSPKAAMLTQRNIVANCLQTKMSEVFKISDILLANLPIFHSFGLLFEVWYMAICGQYTITLYSPLDVKNNIRAIKEKKVTAIIGSPTFLRAYIKHANKDDLATIRVAIAGAEKTPKGFEELWNTSIKANSYSEGYGLTETTPVVAVNLADKDFGFFTTGRRKASVGKLFPWMQAKVLDTNTLEALPFGEQGLLALKGPNIFAGYLKNEAASKCITEDNWLITGDLARLDEDGFIYVDGRLSRFSKIGGEMVPHATVETALNNGLGFDTSQEPLLAISATLDEGKGEALVLLSVEKSLTLGSVKQSLRESGISNLWHPKYIVYVDKIPLLPSGKFDLKAIAKLASQ